ncbi:Putative pentatricopeptide repeat-containing protein At1g31840 [Linum perenne]
MLENRVAPNIVSYTMIIDGLCRRGMVEEASRVLRFALEKKLLPDVVTYTILIRGYCKVGKVEEAMAVYGEMMLCGIRPDGFLLRTLDEYGLAS